jgi:heme exporter protein A
MLRAVNLACVRGRRRLFQGLSFRVEPGEAVWVTGPNGSGKTSLLRIVCTLLAPESGEVLWHETPARELGERFLDELLYIGHAAAVKDDLTALENLHFSLALRGVNLGEAALVCALDAFGLSGCHGLAARALSQGQRRRLALARLKLGAGQDLWVLDEPLAALDMAAVELVRAEVVAHLARGGCVILTSHQDVDLAGVRVQRMRLDA